MKLKLTLITLLIVAAISTAGANVVTIQFNGTGSNSYNGVASAPYYGSVNGVPTVFACIWYNQHISNGESWLARTYTINAFGAYLGNVQLADEIGYVANLIHADGGSKPWENAVAWYLMEQAPDITGDPHAMALYNSLGSMTFTPGEFADTTVYIPVPASTEGPQAFISTTPEPGTLILLGSGLLGLFKFRKGIA